MSEKFKVFDRVRSMDSETLREFFQLRLRMIQEEVDEIRDAETGEDVLDGLIDLAVFTIGALVLFDAEAYEAWNRVHAANMAKMPGVKPGRPNPLGLPDLIKPPGWESPRVDGLAGRLVELFSGEDS